LTGRKAKHPAELLWETLAPTFEDR
jgi:hypothetical protein